MLYGAGIVEFSCGFASSSDLYCDEVPPSNIIKHLGGQADFRGSNLLYRSQDENTYDASVYGYRYCVQNTHSFTPVAVSWRDPSDPTDFVFSMVVAQQDKRFQYHEFIGSDDTKNMELLYGLRKDQWDNDLRLQTIFEKKSDRLDNELIHLIQFQSNVHPDLGLAYALTDPGLLEPVREHIELSESFVI